MEVWLLLIGLVIWLLYVVIEFAIPMALFYFIVSHPYKPYIWILASLLIIWFVARMIVYINKETKGSKK